ncbi:MAG: hypothetical protein COB20_07160 [SAR86 cluster bacterium]|uniref:Uncharacterized protein n=1 Tax=SAR86 cluster bacterium TaxID=2030880 RepID=A0A2A4X541_9GAMM|nr:MAG: hypothetical protein COB20_07160 [SAR86 cluster bacterium]
MALMVTAKGGLEMPTKKIHNARLCDNLKMLLVLGLLTLSPQAISGEYTDALSDCLLTATTEENELSLVRWMFTAMALHPAVEEIADISLSAREQANREMADLLVELLSRRCFSETRLALKNEGSLALQTSFSALGQLAATNLFSDPNVAAGLASIATYISAEDLENRLDIGQ